MYLCVNRHLFRSDDVTHYYEYYPYSETTAAERKTGCPVCAGEFVEADPCLICGQYPEEGNEYDSDGTLSYGICGACFESGLNSYYVEYILEDKQNFCHWLIEFRGMK